MRAIVIGSVCIMRTVGVIVILCVYVDLCIHVARVINDMFGRLNITLVRAIARAILARNMVPADFN